MELIRGLHNLRPRHRGCVATLGNFDGVHRGHQAVIGQLAEQAVKLRLPATVVIFEPQPREYFLGADPVPPRLTRLREKLQALRQHSVERVLCLRFNQALASLTPDEFIHRILIDGLGVKAIVVGDDFRFGAKRAGDIDLLQRVGVQQGFVTVPIRDYAVDGERVSSTRVRAALARSDFDMVERLLGRPYRMCGRVAHGNKLGRTLGVPTANVHLHRLATPLHGVYVVEVTGLGKTAVTGVASIGNRPAVNGERTLLEVHLFDFEREIYGSYIEVGFLSKLRDERNFASLDELKLAMQRDMEQAHTWFATHRPAGRGHVSDLH